MNITGSRDGKVFFIDGDKVMIDGKMYYEKSPQNLPKADAYSLLADVRADIEHLIGYLNITLDLMEQEREEKRILRKSEFIQIRQLCNKVSEHFS